MNNHLYFQYFRSDRGLFCSSNKRKTNNLTIKITGWQQNVSSENIGKSNEQIRFILKGLCQRTCKSEVRALFRGKPTERYLQFIYLPMCALSGSTKSSSAAFVNSGSKLKNKERNQRLLTTYQTAALLSASLHTFYPNPTNSKSAQWHTEADSEDISLDSSGNSNRFVHPHFPENPQIFS